MGVVRDACRRGVDPRPAPVVIKADRGDYAPWGVGKGTGGRRDFAPHRVACEFQLLDGLVPERFVKFGM